MKNWTYSELVKLRTDWLWQMEFWYQQANAGTIGAANEYVLACKLLNYFERKMKNFPAVNMERGWV